MGHARSKDTTRRPGTSRAHEQAARVEPPRPTPDSTITVAPTMVANAWKRNASDGKTAPLMEAKARTSCELWSKRRSSWRTRAASNSMASSFVGTKPRGVAADSPDDACRAEASMIAASEMLNALYTGQRLRNNIGALAPPCQTWRINRVAAARCVLRKRCCRVHAARMAATVAKKSGWRMPSVEDAKRKRREQPSNWPWAARWTRPSTSGGGGGPSGGGLAHIVETRFTNTEAMPVPALAMALLSARSVWSRSASNEKIGQPESMTCHKGQAKTKPMLSDRASAFSATTRTFSAPPRLQRRNSCHAS
mmetsp:Transcript_45838/g.127174  ORF Transcript_45838/g.127174 Transcript_45838/m.127174 type:complete len:308 (+) Transcript_45838:195-1118(+)